MKHAKLLAVSTDGLNWEKPELGKVDWRGSTKNNILSNEPPKRLWGKFDDVSDEAKHAVVYRDGEEVTRVQVKLTADEVNLIQL